MSESWNPIDATLQKTKLNMDAENPTASLRGTLYSVDVISENILCCGWVHSGLTWFMTVCWINTYYIILLIFPKDLCVEYAFNWYKLFLQNFFYYPI